MISSIVIPSQNKPGTPSNAGAVSNPSIISDSAFRQGKPGTLSLLGSFSTSTFGGIGKDSTSFFEGGILKS